MLLTQQAAGWAKWVLVVRRQLQQDLELKRRQAAGLAEATAAGMMRRVMLRMLAAQLAAGWHGWLQHVERIHERRRARERAANLMVKTIGRMLQAQLGAGWNGWRHVRIFMR